MRAYFFATLVLVFLSCNKKESNTIGRQNLPQQTFEFDPNADITLTTKGGAKISILAGTFEGSEPVQLQVKEALSINDIVLAGLTTTSGGFPLKSGGMIYINGEQNKKQAKILKPIEISIPTDSYDADMKVFKGNQLSDTSIDWIEPELMLNREESDLVRSGQVIFQGNCRSCHDIRKNLSGPALAYVTDRRCMEWLKGATRNFARLAGTDLCAKQQVSTYGSVMPSFPQLSDSSIEAIYAYITAESAKMIGEEGGPGWYDPCRKITVRDTSKTKQELVEKTVIGKSNRPEDDDSSLISDILQPDTTPLLDSSAKQLPDEYYTFSIDAFGWFNIDIYINNDPDFVKTKLFVDINAQNKTDLEVYLIIPSKKVFVRGRLIKGNSYVFFYDDDGSIYLPKNQKAYIIGFTNFEEEPLFGKLEFTTLSQSQFSLQLSTGRNVVEEIKSLNLNDLEFEINHHTKEEKILLNERLYQFVCPASDTTGPAKVPKVERPSVE
jgi:hypothetical protein